MALVTVAAGVVLVAPTTATAGGVPASQALVVLVRDHVARTRPSTQAHRVTTVHARRPLTHVRTALPVLGEAESAGLRWLKVRLPGRPNSHTGWIPAANTVPATTTWSVAVKLSKRRVTVYHDGRVARTFRAVVGKPGTPTPTGEFFIEEVVTVLGHDHGGPYALATSALSNVFQEFEGGPGQVAIHGTSRPLGRARDRGLARLHQAQPECRDVDRQTRRCRRSPADHALAPCRPVR